MADPCFRLRRVRLRGGDAARPRLEVEELALEPGVTALIGASGAGKSSLLMVLAGALVPDSGSVAAAQAAPGRLPVFWSPDGAWWPGLTVEEHVRAVAPAEGVGGAGGTTAARLLEEFDLGARARHLPARLSAGERDRLAAVRGLASGAQVLLLDEPFAHLDDTQAMELWQALVGRVGAGGGSLIYATHAPERVLGWAERAVCLQDGRVLAADAVEALYLHPPSAAVSACLGVANWFTSASAELWLGDARHAGCVRPERLAVEACPQPGVTVTASRFHGVFTATTLRQGDHLHTVFHRSATALVSGLTVSLRLLSLFALLLLGACAGPQAWVPRGVTVVAVPPDGPLQPSPRGVAAGVDGEWVVLDTAGRVLVYGPDRQLRRSWRMPEWQVGRPENAVVLADGRVVVADTHYHRVVIFARTGAVERMFGAEGDGPGQFRWPVGVCADAAGNLYVSEYGGHDRIQVFDGCGRYLRAFGGGFSEQPGCFQRPQGICWHAGEVLVADAMNNRIQRFRDDGTFLGVLGGAEAPELRFPYALAVDEHGVVTVVEYSGNRLTRLDGSGRILARFGHAGRGEGEFSTPWSMAMDAGGRIWVADTGNRRLVEVVP